METSSKLAGWKQERESRPVINSFSKSQTQCALAIILNMGIVHNETENKQTSIGVVL